MNIVGTKGYLEVENIGKLDTDRIHRRGLPEVIYCEHKTPEEVKSLFLALMDHSSLVLGTRARPEHFDLLSEIPGIEFHKRAGIIRLQQKKVEHKGLVIVLSAGTSDIPVALEAALTAESFGSHVKTIFDVGVAGLQRVLDFKEELNKASVLVVVAGMDGALPSVVGGLSRVPVIAVPTSTGYGASFGGVAALLSMLSSCSPGVSVVNIDNGFGAGYQAHVINAQSVLVSRD
jgi:pyridinium-3,5-biscarboxylic acid mononucleotide synthase